MLYLIIGVVVLVLMAFLSCMSLCYHHYDYNKKNSAKRKAIKNFYYKHLHSDNLLGFTLWFVAWIGVVIFIILTIIVMCSTANKEARIASMQAERECLIYELENNIYNDNGDDAVGKKELYTQIKQFNQELAYYKIKNNSVWVGVFYSDAYAVIEPIPLK